MEAIVNFLCNYASEQIKPELLSLNLYEIQIYSIAIPSPKEPKEPKESLIPSLIPLPPLSPPKGGIRRSIPLPLPF